MSSFFLAAAPAAPPTTTTYGKLSAIVGQWTSADGSLDAAHVTELQRALTNLHLSESEAHGWLDGMLAQA